MRPICTQFGDLAAALMAPTSTGTVRLASPDPTVDPRVAFRLASSTDDQVRLREAARHLFDLAQHDAIRSIADTAVVGRTGRLIEDFRDDATIDAWIADECIEFHHPTGTCKMGDPRETDIVVDASCASSASRAYASPTPRSSRTSPERTPTSPRSWSANTSQLSSLTGHTSRSREPGHRAASRFGIPVSEVTAQLQKDSAHYLSERGWGAVLSLLARQHRIRARRSRCGAAFGALAGRRFPGRGMCPRSCCACRPRS
jgi:GMC oxidoreductase